MQNLAVNLFKESVRLLVGATALEAVTEEPVLIPKLLRAYLMVGAKICGPPVIDRHFQTIDFLTLLDLETLSPQAQARFLG